MALSRISHDFITSGSSVQHDLFEYVNEFDRANPPSRVAELPIGLQRLLLILNLDDRIFNSGLAGYLGNRTVRNQLLPEVTGATDALRQIGAHTLADIVEEGIRIWMQAILQSQLEPAPGTFHRNCDNAGEARHDGTHCVRSEPLLTPHDEESLDELSAKYRSMGDILNRAVDEYARSHPDEFIHG